MFLPFYYSSSPSPPITLYPRNSSSPICYPKQYSPDFQPWSQERHVVTNSSYSCFTLDDVLLVESDLFVSNFIVIHGIASPLDFTRNGGFGPFGTCESNIHPPDISNKANPVIGSTHT
ncbi:hypothetical protein EUTSA_v10027213mg [Eutrema salsugineum]|uniref:Uncharacterized protein n=1 Tax=Eutrema salsugineum TaxID=72664 RepID=V4MG16_EUTSA|nr:hypothetical protein EUTSA_v10027213mg [Eutrema salsugineum]